MKLTQRQILAAAEQDGWKRVLFTNGAMLRVHSNWTKGVKPDDRFHLFTGGERVARTGTVRQLFKYVKNLEPCCAWCSYNTPAETIMADGFLVCSKCREEVRKYYECVMCRTPLQKNLASWARTRHEEITCGSEQCRKAKDIKYGRLCCEKAERIPCVCTYSYKCPVHAPNGVHVGTHD